MGRCQNPCVRQWSVGLNLKIGILLIVSPILSHQKHCEFMLCYKFHTDHMTTNPIKVKGNIEKSTKSMDKHTRISLCSHPSTS